MIISESISTTQTEFTNAVVGVQHIYFDDGNSALDQVREETKLNDTMDEILSSGGNNKI